MTPVNTEATAAHTEQKESTRLDHRIWRYITPHTECRYYMYTDSRARHSPVLSLPSYRAKGKKKEVKVITDGSQLLVKNRWLSSSQSYGLVTQSDDLDSSLSFRFLSSLHMRRACCHQPSCRSCGLTHQATL